MPPTYKLQILGPSGLVGADGASADALVRQPKRLAILAYIALTTTDGFCRRDPLVGLFWPEFDQAAGRTYLRKALYSMREALGGEIFVTRGDDELRLDPARIWCDAVAHREGIAAGRWEEALSLYKGELLDGLYPEGVSQEFEEWLSTSRKRLRLETARAAWECSRKEEERGDRAAAVALARRARELDPDDESTVQRLLLLLDRLGDRGSALREYALWQSRLQVEFGVEPAPETRRIARRVQDARRGESHETPPAVAAPAPETRRDPHPSSAPVAHDAPSGLLRGETAVASVPSPSRSRWFVAATVATIAIIAFSIIPSGFGSVNPRSIGIETLRVIGTSASREFLAAFDEELIVQLALDTTLSVRREQTAEDVRTLGSTFGTARSPRSAFRVTSAVQQYEDRIRVTIRLERAEDGVSVWAGVFEDSSADVAASASRVAEKAAGEIRLFLGAQAS